MSAEREWDNWQTEDHSDMVYDNSACVLPSFMLMTFLVRIMELPPSQVPTVHMYIVLYCTRYLPSRRVWTGLHRHNAPGHLICTYSGTRCMFLSPNKILWHHRVCCYMLYLLVTRIRRNSLYRYAYVYVSVLVATVATGRGTIILLYIPNTSIQLNRC